MPRFVALRAVVVALVIVAGCRAADERPPVGAAADSVAPTPAPVAEAELPLGLALKDDGRAVELAPAQVVLVSLHANHSTGYRWVLADSVGPALAREGEPAYDVDSTAGVGAGGFEMWRFRAAAAGADTIVLEYRRPSETGRRAETTVRYYVTVR